jgi:hypothetical protein
MGGLGTIVLLAALPHLFVDGLVRVQDPHPLEATGLRLDHVVGVLQYAPRRLEGVPLLGCIDGHHAAHSINDDRLLTPLEEHPQAGGRHLGREIERAVYHLNRLSIGYHHQGVLQYEVTFHQLCGLAQTVAESRLLLLGNIVRMGVDHLVNEPEAQVRVVPALRRKMTTSRRNVKHWMGSLLTTLVPVRLCVALK